VIRNVDRRAVLSLLGGAAVSSVLSACGDDTKSSDSGGLPVVRWGYFRNYQPVYVGIEKDLFRKAGVDVKLTGTFNNGPAVVQAAGTGQVDAGHSAITGLAGAVAAGIKVTGVADSQTEFVDVPLQQWFVHKDSGIMKIADLRGKKIGTNALSGSFYYTAQLALKHAGLDKNDVKFVTLAHDKQQQALLAGQIDAAGVIDPYSVKLAKETSVRRLFTGAEVLGERQFSLIFFTNKFLKNNPDTVKKFLTAYRQTITFMQENPAEASALMAKRLGLEAGDVIPHRYTENAAVHTKDVQFWIDLMRENGELKDAPDLKASELVDESFNV